MNDDVVRARIPAGIKKRARVVLHKIGMTESDAFRMMMYRIVAEKQLPFASCPTRRRLKRCRKPAGAG